MAYALFSDSTQVSKAFRTKADVWHHADASGLVLEIGSSEEDPPKRILDMGCVIRECASDIPVAIKASAETGDVAGEVARIGIARQIVACPVSQPSAAAAS